MPTAVCICRANQQKRLRAAARKMPDAVRHGDSEAYLFYWNLNYGRPKAGQREFPLVGERVRKLIKDDRDIPESIFVVVNQIKIANNGDVSNWKIAFIGNDQKDAERVGWSKTFALF